MYIQYMTTMGILYKCTYIHVYYTWNYDCFLVTEAGCQATPWVLPEVSEQMGHSLEVNSQAWVLASWLGDWKYSWGDLVCRTLPTEIFSASLTHLCWFDRCSVHSCQKSKWEMSFFKQHVTNLNTCKRLQKGDLSIQGKAIPLEHVQSGSEHLESW